MIDPAAVNAMLPAVPVNPSRVILPWLVRLTFPPACRLPLAFIAIWLPLNAVVPLPAVSWPLLVSLPAAFSVIPLPCNVDELVILPWLLMANWLFAAITP